MQVLRDEIERRKFLEMKVKEYVGSLVGQNNRLKDSLQRLQVELEREKPDFSKLREICVLDDDEAEEGSESEGQISDL